MEDVPIYCNGEMTKAVEYLGRWYCDRCSKEVRVVLHSTPVLGQVSP